MKKLLFICFMLLSCILFSEPLTKSLIKEIPDDLNSFGKELKTMDNSDSIKGLEIVGATLLVMHFDEDIRKFALDHHSDTLDTLAPIFRHFGEFYPPLIFLGTGYLFDNDKSVKTGIYSLEASLIGAGITFVGKNLFARARPYMNEGSDSWGNENFNPDYSSFPSGHSTVAFATAAVIAEMYKDTKGVPELAYTLATLTALSRIYNDKHWASDTFLGGTIGYLTGKTLMNIKNKSNASVIPSTDGTNFSITFGASF